ncbi:MAG: tRNA pseudouridine(13) synthase TruD, partial [Phycisphaerales bacterium]|nr:tRNA pseudouridine(13) synthase TruD [Phycisphaerales bacterium]
MQQPRRLLADLAPARGIIKSDYEDFVVEEVPRYPFDGDGSHVLFLVEKTGIGSMQAVNDIARALGVPRREIGLAGLKDARAVSRQWMSLEHADSDRIRALTLPRIRIVEVTRHHNKLRLGHLKENRFHIRVRDIDTGRYADLRNALELLVRRGVPNYFGEQRFGGSGSNAAVGRALLLRQDDEAVDLILGRPNEMDHGDVRRARKAYEAGKFEEALRLWPRMFREQRTLLGILLKRKGDKRRAAFAIDRVMRRFYISAYQSELFNRVVETRMPSGLDRLMDGDLAWLHVSGAVFRVESATVEQPRADAFEISPTGPIFGYRMTQPTGEPERIERETLAAEHLHDDMLKFSRQFASGGR